MKTELAKLIAEEQMAKAVWLSCKSRLEKYTGEQTQNKKVSQSCNRAILKRMKQMTRTC